MTGIGAEASVLQRCAGAKNAAINTARVETPGKTYWRGWFAFPRWRSEAATYASDFLPLPLLPGLASAADVAPFCGQVRALWPD